MSEQVTVTKKKKKQDEKKLTVTEAIAILKPFVVKWKRQDEEMANKMYEIYQQCEWGDWSKVLDALNFPSSTWDGWCSHFGFERKYPQLGHDNTTDTESGQLDQQKLEGGTEEKFEELPAEAFEQDTYQETFTILNKAEHLNKSDFEIGQKQELIEKLQHVIKKLNGLLLRLESDL